VGKAFGRFGIERVIGASIILFSLGLLTLAALPKTLIVLGALCFLLGFVSSGTTIVGYMSVLPKWFDAHLGLALGLGGIGNGVGVVLTPFIATNLLGRFGWRGAYAGLAVVAAGAGFVAWLLISVRGHNKAKDGIEGSAASWLPSAVAHEGIELRQALADWRFWLLMAVILLTTFSIFGGMVHGVNLAFDRGLTPQQAAVVASLAGVGGILARVLIGAMLDRYFAPILGAIVFATAAAGLFINSTATAFPLIVSGTILVGFAFGGEGDLIPFLVRRYFGPKAFGAIYGMMYVAFTLGAASGPVVYGIAYDHSHSYELIMYVTSGACLACALCILLVGTYRFRAVKK
jgi:MFS family permease